MKLFSKSILAMMAIVATLGFTACSDDDDYVPGASAEGAYFAKTNPSSIEVNLTATVFDFTVLRSDDSKAETFPLTVSAPEGVSIDGFTVPASVSFEAGQKEANVIVTVDITKVERDKEYNLEFKIGGADVYGAELYRVTFVRSMPLTTVACPPAGRGAYTYACMASGTYGWFPVTMTYNPEDPTHNVIYTVKQWGYDLFSDNGVDMQILMPDTEAVNADGLIPVTVPVFYTGYTRSDGIAIYACDMCTFCTDVWGRPDQAAFYESGTYDPETGVFDLNMIYCDPASPGSYYGSIAYEQLSLDGFPDYSVSLGFQGFSIDVEGNYFANALLETGADVAITRIGYMPSFDPEEVLTATILGTCPYVEVEGAVAEEGKTVNLPFTDMGDYIAMAITYNAAGEPQNLSYCQFSADFGGGASASEWESIGMCNYADGWILCGFTIDGQPIDVAKFAFDVELCAHKTDANRFLLKQPYGPGFPAYSNSAIQGVKRDIEFQVLPALNCAFIQPQETGFAFDPGKMISIMNREGLLRSNPDNDGYDDAVIVDFVKSQYPGEGTVYEDGVITVPVPRFIEDGSIYSWKVPQASVLQIDPEAVTTAAKARAARIAAPKAKALSSSARVSSSKLDMAMPRVMRTGTNGNVNLRGKLR